jgi:hypothetical protein
MLSPQEVDAMWLDAVQEATADSIEEAAQRLVAPTLDRSPEFDQTHWIPTIRGSSIADLPPVELEPGVLAPDSCAPWPHLTVNAQLGTFELRHVEGGEVIASTRTLQAAIAAKRLLSR